MKICPQCAFTNEERFPACLWCNELLVHVPSIPSADPAHPEHARRELDARRHARLRGQFVWAALVYGVAGALLAVWPGAVRDPATLALHFVVALLVATAVVRRWAGPHLAMLLHGAASAALVYVYGPVQVLVFFMILGHILFPNVFWHWSELLEDNGR